MMFTFYIDVGAWTRPDNCCPTTNPLGHKMADAKRFMVQVDIPHPAEIDAKVEGKATEIQKL